MVLSTVHSESRRIYAGAAQILGHARVIATVRGAHWRYGQKAGPRADFRNSYIVVRFQMVSVEIPAHVNRQISFQHRAGHLQRISVVKRVLPKRKWLNFGKGCKFIT